MAHPPGTGPAAGRQGTVGLRVAHVRPLRVDVGLADRNGGPKRDTHHFGRQKRAKEKKGVGDTWELFSSVTDPFNLSGRPPRLLGKPKVFHRLAGFGQFKNGVDANIKMQLYIVGGYRFITFRSFDSLRHHRQV